MSRTKAKKPQPQQPQKGKGNNLRAIGVIILIYAAVALLNNWGIWHPWLISNLTWLWNPLSLLTPHLVGHTFLLSNFAAWLLNGIFTAFWPFIAGIIGLVLVK
jgi:hypothetical protein